MKSRIDPLRRGLAAAPLLTLLPRTGAAQAFPSKPIRLVVPYPPGGTSSMILNLLAKMLQERNSLQLVLDYRPGAGGNIGVDLVLKAPPDGYTIGFTAMNSFAINPHLTKKLPYDVSRDVQPITLVGSVPNILTVNPEVKAKTLKELVALSQTMDMSYAIPGGPGTSIHLSGEMLVNQAGLKMRAIPYKGDAPALQDVLGGRVPVMMSNLTAAAEYVKAGRLRAIAVTSARRAPAVPQVPTVAESGVPDFDAGAYFLLFTARGVPSPVVATLNRELTRVIDSPQFRTQLAGSGLDARGSSVERVTALIAMESRRWGEEVRRLGVTWD